MWLVSGLSMVSAKVLLVVAVLRLHWATEPTGVYR